MEETEIVTERREYDDLPRVRQQTLFSWGIKLITKEFAGECLLLLVQQRWKEKRSITQARKEVYRVVQKWPE